MSIKIIPVRKVLDYRGRPIKTQQLDNDMEKVYKTIGCPGSDCDFSTTSLEVLQGHLSSHGENETREAQVSLIPELIDSDTRYLILDVLQNLNISNPQHPVVTGKIRRSADSLHASRVWAVVWDAIEHDLKEIRLKKSQYDWLHKLLERKLVETGVKEEERKTLAEQIFGLSWYSSIQNLLVSDERDESEEELEGVVKFVRDRIEDREEIDAS